MSRHLSRPNNYQLTISLQKWKTIHFSYVRLHSRSASISNEYQRQRLEAYTQEMFLVWRTSQNARGAPTSTMQQKLAIAVTGRDSTSNCSPLKCVVGPVKGRLRCES